jgi:hypothetical protein
MRYTITSGRLLLGQTLRYRQRDVEPAYDASGLYTKLGFDFADPHESLPPEMPYRTMYFDLKPVIELFNPQPSEAESD